MGLFSSESVTHDFISCDICVLFCVKLKIDCHHISTSRTPVKVLWSGCGDEEGKESGQ